MTGTEAIKSALTSMQFMLDWRLKDLDDVDFLVRTVPSANHAAWQLGRIINADVGLVRSQFPDAERPELPAGFSDLHLNENAEADVGFLTKAQYADLFARACAA